MSRILTAAHGRWVLVTCVSAAVVAGIAASTSVAEPPAPGVPVPGAAVRIGLPAVRVALDVAAVTAVGLAVLSLLIRGERERDAGPILAAARRAGLVVGAVWTSCVILLLWLQAAELSNQGLGLTTTAFGDYVVTVSAGRTLLLAGACALVYALLNAVAMGQSRHGPAPRRQDKPGGTGMPVELVLITALLGLLPLPLGGHAATAAYPELAQLSTGLHVVGVAAWVGGLACVFALVAPRRALLARTLPRFAALANVCLVVVAASGVTSATVALIRGPGTSLPDVLFGTGYGWLVLGKATCLIVVAGIGGRIRLRLLPAISAHRSAPLALWVGAELAVMAIALGFAAALSRAPVS